MNIKLKYGDSVKSISIPDRHVLEVIEPPALEPLPDVRAGITGYLRQPSAGPSLYQILQRRKTSRILAVVSDITRDIPQYPEILEAITDEIIREIGDVDLRFLIATGSHRPLAPDEIRSIYGCRLPAEYRFINHDCDAPDLVEIGRLSSGKPIMVNPLVKWADTIIVTGRVAPHYFAGFSGGRKSILPGISGRELIRSNHSRVAHEGVQLGNLKGNPIHEEMLEAVHRVGVDFMVNVVLNANHQAAEVFTGEIAAAHTMACRSCWEKYGVVRPRKADCVITSSGGFPQDISVFQMQRALHNTRALLKPGGTWLLVGEAREGIGQRTFESWLTGAGSPEELLTRHRDKITIGGHTAIMTAKLLVRYRIGMLSCCTPEQLQGIFFEHFSEAEEGVSFMLSRYGPDFTTYIVPDGTLIMAGEQQGTGGGTVPDAPPPEKKPRRKRKSGSSFWKKKSGRRSRKKKRYSRLSFIIWGALLGMLFGYLIMWSNGYAGSLLMTFWTNLVHDIVHTINSVFTFVVDHLAIILGGILGALIGYYVYNLYHKKHPS